MRHQSCFVAVSLVAVIALTAAAHQTDTRVPEFVIRAAEDTAMDFARALSEAGVSAGFEVPDSAINIATTKAWGRQNDRMSTVALNDVLKVFRGRHPEYEVSHKEAVVLVRGRAVADDSKNPLNTKIAAIRLGRVRLRKAFTSIARILDPSVSESSGYVGSVISEVSSPPPGPLGSEDPTVTVDIARAVTPWEALNEFVKQAAGTVWLRTCPDAARVTTISRLAYLRPGHRMSPIIQR